MTDLREEIGQSGVVIADELAWGFEPTETGRGVIAAMLGLAIQAQCEELSDDQWSVLTGIGFGEPEVEAAFNEVAGHVMAAVNAVLAAWEA